MSDIRLHYAIQDVHGGIWRVVLLPNLEYRRECIPLHHSADYMERVT
jgi:hypothetical protein